MKFVLLSNIVLATFFIQGCQSSFFSKKYEAFKHKKCFNLEINNAYLANTIKTTLKKENFSFKKTCPTLICYNSGIKVCSSPNIQASYQGFIRCSIKTKEKEVYRIQYNYENKSKEKKIKEMIKFLIKENER